MLIVTTGAGVVDEPVRRRQPDTVKYPRLGHYVAAQESQIDPNVKVAVTLPALKCGGRLTGGIDTGGWPSGILRPKSGRAETPSARKVDASPLRPLFTRGLDGAEQCVATARTSKLTSEGG